MYPITSSFLCSFLCSCHFLPFLLHSTASLLIDSPVTNIAENNAIIIICSNVNPISNIVSAILPPTSGEKNDTPKLPNILIKPLDLFNL